MIKINDYVILKEDTENIVKNSVGFVESIINSKLKVFFLGKKKYLELKESKLQPLDISQTGKPFKYKICNICHILIKPMQKAEKPHAPVVEAVASR